MAVSASTERREKRKSARDCHLSLAVRWKIKTVRKGGAKEVSRWLGFGSNSAVLYANPMTPVHRSYLAVHREVGVGVMPREHAGEEDRHDARQRNHLFQSVVLVMAVS
jgi:hypothetical protein